MIIESISAFGLVGFSCEMGQRFTTNFDEVNDDINKLNWYKFPIEVQRLLPILTLVTQQQLVVECFGSVACLRESFKSVSTTKLNRLFKE